MYAFDVRGTIGRKKTGSYRIHEKSVLFFYIFAQKTV